MDEQEQKKIFALAEKINSLVEKADNSDSYLEARELFTRALALCTTLKPYCKSGDITLRPSYSEYTCGIQKSIDLCNQKLEVEHAQHSEPTLDLETIEGINSIPVTKTTFQGELGSDYYTVQYKLQRKATEHKRNNRMDLAIACLRKANEFMSQSKIQYSKKDYMRLVEYLKKDSQFGLARKEQTKIEALFAKTLVETSNEKRLNQGKSWGYDLVRCTTHHPTCEVCAQYQGRVYALTREAANGKYKGPNGEGLQFPLLYETALSHGREAIHQNCRHSFSILPASVFSRKELSELSRNSMQPFEDTRSDAERKAYAQEQAVKRQRNADLHEWRKYRALLPEDAPTTFAGFRRMKKANSVRYQRLQWDARFFRKYGSNAEHSPLNNFETPRGISDKLTAYSLNSEHEYGKHKAVVFQGALGYNQGNAGQLEEAIKAGLNRYRAIPIGDDGYGPKFNVMLLVDGPNGKRQPVKTTWIYDNGLDTPRMVTCYVEKNKRA